MRIKIIVLLYFLSSLQLCYSLVVKNLSCSRAGTDILLVNGIGWSEGNVKYILRKIEKPSNVTNFNSYLDLKLPNKKYVSFKYSYNNSNGFSYDILESAAQKISQNFGISISDAFVLAYYFTYRGAVSIDFVEKIINTKDVSFKQISSFLYSYFTQDTLEQLIKKSYLENIENTKGLKESISQTLLSGKKLILITESQGNFFGKQAILDFQNGESLNFNGKTGLLNDYIKTIGQVQIAPPTGPILPKNKLVLNDKDLINVIFLKNLKVTLS